MLHVAPNLAVVGSLKHSGVPGKIIAWDEELYVGPTPSGLSLPQWRSARVSALAPTYPTDPGFWPIEIEKQDTALEAYHDHEEVVIWLGASLADQLILMRHLDWFAGQHVGQTKVSLVRVGEPPDHRKPRGLEMLNSSDLLALLWQRHEVTREEYRLAQDSWSAFCSPDPTMIEQLLAQDTSPLPYLRDALVRHLEQFPSMRNGLNREENAALMEAAQGDRKLMRVVGTLFVRDDGSGFRASYLGWSVEQLGRAKVPAVRIFEPRRSRTRRPGEARHRPDPVLARYRSMVALTPTGRELLAGRADWVRLNGIDRWLGGVHLRGAEAAWRWDEERGRLVGG